MSKQKTSIGEYGVLWLVRATSLLLQWLPHSAALSLGRFAGFAASFLVRRRRVAYANLKAAFGTRFSAKDRRTLVRRNFVHLAQNVVEIFRFPKLDKAYVEKEIRIKHRKYHERLAVQGNGIIFLTPHFGNWELTQVVAALSGKPLHVLARQQKHSALDDFLNQLRASHGAVTIHKGRGIRDFISVLQQGGNVGALGDLSGGREGAVIRFFGRKTTAPTGIFLIARRTGASILPCFSVRTSGATHLITLEEPFQLSQTGDEDQDVRIDLQNYYELLESWIKRHPDQWLWVYKRWKYGYTKKVLVLTDDRAGHTNQSEAIAQEIKQLQGILPKEFELEFHTLKIVFKSKWHQKLFYACALFFLPFAQSRLRFFKWFLTSDSALALRHTYADVIISAGSALAPVNLALKCENQARSIAVMKPSFPYGPKKFDLAIIPEHDDFGASRSGVVRTVIAPSCVDQDLLNASADALSQKIGLDADTKRISVFVGGSTGSYELDPKAVGRWLVELKRCAEELNYELLVTTSRRTDAETSAVLKRELQMFPRCKLLVIANESNVEGVVYGMLALSEVALITEDSISMISDAVRAKKPTLILELGNQKLARKHKRFAQALTDRKLAEVANQMNFRAKFDGARSKVAEAASELGTDELQEALSHVL